MKKNFYLNYFIVVVISLICITIITNIKTQTKNVFVEIKFASIVIYIKDLHTNQPIDNATICILNTKEYYSSDKNGYSETIKLPLFEEFKSDDCFMFNILVYKKGYNDYIYFNLKIKQGQKRSDIVIPLSSIINEDDIRPSICFELPYQQSIENIIRENKR